MFVDSHCHLAFPELSGDLPGVLARMRSAGVEAALSVCTTLPEFPAVLASAAGHDNVYASVGVHPDSTGTPEPSVEALVDLAGHAKVLAIGETGLDYYRLPEPLDWQRERFRVHIRAARACRKPLIIHTRSAAADTLRIMREEGAADVGGVMHCFTESEEVARHALDLGFYISFSGIVTFKSARDLQATAAMVPLDRLLIETDSPYLAPVPHRGKSNEPAFVPHVAAKLAELRNVEVDAIGSATTANFYRLFNVLKP
jgi:TatD DNase family protein